jgi:hypothetical protein
MWHKYPHEVPHSCLYAYYPIKQMHVLHFLLSARVLGKHQGTVPPRPNVPPDKLVSSSGPEQLSAAEVDQRMKLLREDR